MSYIYLASPYSDPSPAVREERFFATERATAWLLRERIWVYSPIVHCHALALRYGLPTDAGFWQEYNFAMLRGAAALWLLKLSGWENSIGMRSEIAFAGREGIPVQEFLRGSVAEGNLV